MTDRPRRSDLSCEMAGGAAGQAASGELRATCDCLPRRGGRKVYQPRGRQTGLFRAIIGQKRANIGHETAQIERAATSSQCGKPGFLGVSRDAAPGKIARSRGIISNSADLSATAAVIRSPKPARPLFLIVLPLAVLLAAEGFALGFAQPTMLAIIVGHVAAMVVAGFVAGPAIVTRGVVFVFLFDFPSADRARSSAAEVMRSCRPLGIPDICWRKLPRRNDLDQSVRSPEARQGGF